MINRILELKNKMGNDRIISLLIKRDYIRFQRPESEPRRTVSVHADATPTEIAAVRKNFLLIIQLITF